MAPTLNPNQASIFALDERFEDLEHIDRRPAASDTAAVPNDTKLIKNNSNPALLFNAEGASAGLGKMLWIASADAVMTMQENAEIPEALANSDAFTFEA